MAQRYYCPTCDGESLTIATTSSSAIQAEQIFAAQQAHVGRGRTWGRDRLEHLFWARRKAARCLRSGWTLDQAAGQYSEYGWVRSLDKSPRRPLTALLAAERQVSA